MVEGTWFACISTKWGMHHPEWTTTPEVGPPAEVAPLPKGYAWSGPWEPVSVYGDNPPLTLWRRLAVALTPPQPLADIPAVSITCGGE